MPGRCCRPATCPARPRPWPPASRAPDTWRRTRGCRGRSPGGSGAPWRPPARAPPPPRSGSTRRHPHTAAWRRGHEVLGVVTIHLAQTIHTNVKALEALVRAFSVIVKTDCETDGPSAALIVCRHGPGQHLASKYTPTRQSVKVANNRRKLQS